MCSRWLHLERLLDPSTTVRCELAGRTPKGPRSIEFARSGGLDCNRQYRFELMILVRSPTRPRASICCSWRSLIAAAWSRTWSLSRDTSAAEAEGSGGGGGGTGAGVLRGKRYVPLTVRHAITANSTVAMAVIQSVMDGILDSWRERREGKRGTQVNSIWVRCWVGYPFPVCKASR